jgi:hypothetical protein
MTPDDLETFRKSVADYTAKATSSPEMARATLMREGIYLEDGSLSPNYQADEHVGEPRQVFEMTLINDHTFATPSERTIITKWADRVREWDRPDIHGIALEVAIFLKSNGETVNATGFEDCEFADDWQPLSTSIIDSQRGLVHRFAATEEAHSCRDCGGFVDRIITVSTPHGIVPQITLFKSGHMNGSRDLRTIAGTVTQYLMNAGFPVRLSYDTERRD